MNQARPCGNPDCGVSSGIHEHDNGKSRTFPDYWHGLTFGAGELDGYGYWEHPCDVCARHHEAVHPEDGPCWPFTDEGRRAAGFPVESEVKR